MLIRAPGPLVPQAVHCVPTHAIGAAISAISGYCAWASIFSAAQITLCHAGIRSPVPRPVAFCAMAESDVIGHQMVSVLSRV